MEWPLEDERQLLADCAVPGRHPHSLWNFVRFAAGWHYRCLAWESSGRGPYWLTDAHKDFCDWLQAQIEEWVAMRKMGRMERIQIIAWLFRGFGKTNLVTTCVPAYLMLAEPDLACQIGSETHPKAKEFLDAIKPYLDGSDPQCRFAWFYGDWYHPNRTWTTDRIVTAHRHSPGIKEPSIGTFGVETGITGKHPQCVIYDDPISEEKLKEGGNWLQSAITSMDSIYPALTNDSILILIGTRYRQDDVIGTALEAEGVHSWAGHPQMEEFKQGGAWRVYFLQARDVMDTKEFPKGRPVTPKTWSDRAMNLYEARNPTNYRLQLMGNAMDDTQNELSRERIQTMLIDRQDLPPIEYATIHIDTAFKLDARKSRGDRNAIVTWLHDIRPTGVVYLDRVLCSAQWGSEDFDRNLIRVLADLRGRGIRVRAITDESEMGGKRGIYIRHLQDVIGQSGLRIPEILQLNRAGTLKVVRIREAANYWLEGLVKLVRDAENIHILVEEMVHMGFSRYDDVADAAADVWRPEIWRGRRNQMDDQQPFLPIQPGDDVLKARRDRELLDIEYQLRTGRPRDEYGHDLQPVYDNGEEAQW